MEKNIYILRKGEKGSEVLDKIFVEDELSDKQDD